MARSVASLLAPQWESSRCVERFLSFFYVLRDIKPRAEQRPVRFGQRTLIQFLTPFTDTRLLYVSATIRRVPLYTRKGCATLQRNSNSKMYIQTKPLCDNVKQCNLY
jgi:hypothetical protein